jgi:putative hydroxymethylpyrimidine transport system permease protein
MLNRLILPLSILGLWWVITHDTQIPSFLLPQPEQVLQVFLHQWHVLAYHTSFSLFEVILGLTLGSVTALILAFSMARTPTLRSPLLSLLTSLQAIPIFALLPLLILWLGPSLMTKIIVVSLSCFFPITIGALQGFNRIPQGYLDLGHLFHAKNRALFRHLELPAILPYLFAGFRIAAVHAPITVIAADWIGATQGLGYLIMLASGRLQVDLLFAGIICLIGLSLSLHKACNLIQKTFLYWKNEI